MDRDTAVFHLLQSIKGEDVDREGLLETPQRVSKMWDELTSGYSVDIDGLFKTFGRPNLPEDKYKQGIITVSNIPFTSCCEHHMVPFFGKAHIAYIPSDRIVGLSKFARVVEAYARRLQVQERMNNEIIEAIVKNLQPQAVMVILEAEHMCMTIRGVQKAGTITHTSRIYGDFITDSRARDEAMRLMGL